jgi:hypothetical protein
MCARSHWRAHAVVEAFPSGLMAHPAESHGPAEPHLASGRAWPVWVLHSQRSGATWVDDERRWRTRTATRPGGRTHPRPHWVVLKSSAVGQGVVMMTGLRVGGRTEAHHGMFHVERCSETHAAARTITHAGRRERLVDEHQVPAQPRCHGRGAWRGLEDRERWLRREHRAGGSSFFCSAPKPLPHLPDAAIRNCRNQQMPRLRRSKTDWWRNR